jgi:hypothetical protein
MSCSISESAAESNTDQTYLSPRDRRHFASRVQLDRTDGELTVGGVYRTTLSSYRTGGAQTCTKEDNCGVFVAEDAAG